MLLGGRRWKSAQRFPGLLTTIGFVNATPVALGVATDSATVNVDGLLSPHAWKLGAYRLPTMKCAPPSMATSIGSPDHCSSGLPFGSPTRSRKLPPPSV